MSIKVKDFLQAVRENLVAEHIGDADRVVEVVAEALKAGIPAEERFAPGRPPPAHPPSALKEAGPLPADFFERESLYREDGLPEGEALGYAELPAIEETVGNEAE